MRTTLKSILSDTLRARKVLTREDTWTIGESYGYIQSTIDRIFRKKDGNCILCIKLNSKGVEAKGDDFVYAYKWNGGETKFKIDYDQQTRTETRKRKLDKKSKDKRTNVKTGKTRLDSRKTRKTKTYNETRKRSKTSKIKTK